MNRILGIIITLPIIMYIVVDTTCMVSIDSPEILMYDYDNTSPYPPQIEGPINCNITEKHDYYITISDPDGANGDRLMELQVFFGDGTNKSIKHHDTGCTKGWRSGTILTVAHRWKKPFNYTIRARVMDYALEWSDWGCLDVHVTQTSTLTLNSLPQNFLPLIKNRLPSPILFFS